MQTMIARQMLNCTRLSRSISNEASSRLEAIKKEWNVSLGKTDDDKEYTIRLNNVNLKTPMGNLLRVQDETLAIAIANEWKSKAGKKKLDLPSMCLTTLAYNAIDNPFNETNEVVANSILTYLAFDTIRFRATENEELLRKQSRHWDPLIGWFENKFDCHLPIEYGSVLSTGALPKITQETVIRHLLTHKRWPLVGLRYITENLKSLVLASSLTERFLTVEQAVDLALLETKHQTGKWSEVEWAHNIDEQCTNARAAAGTLFYHLTV